jgi:hypothetical protein
LQQGVIASEAIQGRRAQAWIAFLRRRLSAALRINSRYALLAMTAYSVELQPALVDRGGEALQVADNLRIGANRLAYKARYLRTRQRIRVLV